MDPPCHSTRDRLASQVDGVLVPEGEPLAQDARPGDIDRHLAECAACRAWYEAFSAARVRQVAALEGLGRRAAPAELDALVAGALRSTVREDRAAAALSRLLPLKAPDALDGAVVASLQAGSRQERALRHLGGLERRDAPASLDRRAADVLAGPDAASAADPRLSGSSSPAVLERLVREDLADLPRALSRRFLDKLTRRPAPPALEGRVRADLAAPAGRLLRPRFGRGSRAAAAGFLVLLGALGWARFGDATTPDEDEPRTASFAFDLRHLSPADAFADEALDPMTRRLADEVSHSRLSLGTDALASEVPGDDPPSDDPEAPDGPDSPDGSGGTAPGGDGSGSEPAAPAPGGSPLSPGPERIAHLSRELLTRMQSAPFLPIGMTRRVELYGSDSGTLELAFEEELLRDGLGGFAVQPTEVLHPVMTAAEESTFLLLQAGRQGYVERHRDFRVRDASAFLQNYSVIDLVQIDDVAGRHCLLLEVQGRLDATVSWRLAVDYETGLVLREERRDAWGKLLSRVETLQLDETPDLGNAVLDGGPNAWTPVDTSTLTGVTIHVPTQLPLGFTLDETATQVDGLGRLWLRRVYSDGLRELFFLHELVATGPTLQRLNTTNQHRDVVNSFAIGGVQILDGELQGVRVIAMGMLSEYELLQWMSSAL